MLAYTERFLNWWTAKSMSQSEFLPNFIYKLLTIIPKSVCFHT